jgi:delta-1-pyrroline-5-carboxylate synthetase
MVQDSDQRVLWDNDSLAALVAGETNVDIVILLSDVEGLYKEPPSASGKKGELIDTYQPEAKFTIGAGSRTGRGGMQAKIAAAQYALSRGAYAVVIASGYGLNVITNIVAGARVGTLFVEHPEKELATARQMASASRKAAQALLALGPQRRQALLEAIANNLIAAKGQILDANQRDIANARDNNLRPALAARLVLDEKKLQTLASGVKQIAAGEDPIGKVLKRRELADGLVLEEVRVPIGVLLVIFEARPDVLPQVAALAIRSGNGLILKGGKEALHTNTVLHGIITRTVEQFGVGPQLVGLVQTYEQIDELLQIKEIDLVIPRGSAELVSHIQNNTRIPVLGHSEGLCHVYVDKAADLATATRIVVDAKTDYPAACNAAETLLIHSDLISDRRAHAIIDTLARSNVKLFAAPNAASHFPDLPHAQSLRTEYSDLGMTVEVVESLEAAIAHINEYGSGHTDAIITEDKEAAQAFSQFVDSACVFHNASTRFSDGYRFGLGAEVGISTSRIHARGPVGIEGLLSSKWVLVSQTGGSIAADFSTGKRTFTHRDIYPPFSPQPASVFANFQPKL